MECRDVYDQKHSICIACNVASAGSAVKSIRSRIKVHSPPETIIVNSTFQAKTLRRLASNQSL